MQGDEISVLLENVKKDDRQAFDQLFRLFYPRLVKFAIQFLRERQDAEDAVAVFFIRLWQKRNRLPPLDYPETYIYTAVKNTCLNYKRDRKSKTMLHQTDGDAKNYSPETFQQPDESKELKLLLEKAIAALPVQRRLIFILVKEEGLKCREAAAILNLSVRTVESQLYKAVKTLARAISQHLGYDPQQKKQAEA
ncbi:MAG: RNA polymerase sigma-70 factor [Niabella sp.]|nr:RNA polymerase sigma-70 factor [Niabella sp.]